MSFERWGTLSVSDHNDINALVANVILYDRLVIPVFTETTERDESVYWGQRGWDADNQQLRLEQLGDLAVLCPWNSMKKQCFAKTYQLQQQLRDEVGTDMACTRFLLTQNTDGYQLPQGVNHADVVMGFSSDKNALQAFDCESYNKHFNNEKSQIAVLLAHTLAVPDHKNPEDSLQDAIQLSLDSEYRNKRAALHDFQCTKLAHGIPPQAIVNELKSLSDELNAVLTKNRIPVRKKVGGTLLKIATGIGTLNPASAIGALLDLFQLAQDIQTTPTLPGRLEPVAAFHQLTAKTGIQF